MDNRIETIVSLSNESENTMLDDYVMLPHGEALSIEETYNITGVVPVEFAVLVGASDSGKTTLVTSIYHLFNKNPVAGYYFAGSETLFGFEQRAYRNRTNSDGTLSQTNKSPRGSLDILHLKLFDPVSAIYKDILISDFSGEDYQDMIGNIDLAKKDFKIISHANHVIILIDGDLISQKSRRNGTEQDFLQLLRTISDAELLKYNAKVTILISKYDLIKKRSSEDTTVTDYIDKMKRKVQDRFSKMIKNIKFSEIAALPNDNTIIEVGFGLEELICSLLKSDQPNIMDFKLNVHSQANKHGNIQYENNYE